MKDKKLFGYPAFNSDGEKVLTTYDNEYRDMLMDIRVFKMADGACKVFSRPEEETAILLQSGKITLEWDGERKTASRRNVFTFNEGPWCLHVCKGVEIKVIAEKDSEILVQCTHNKNSFTSKLYSPQEAPWVDVCRGKYGNTANRFVNTIFDYNNAPYSNMVLGEVMNDRGNWSGFIPHTHPQPEAYYFLFDRPEGFGASFVGNDVFKITDGSFSAIPGGKTHPQSAAPGYYMYTCWMIRHLDGNPWTDRIDDPAYTWLNDAKF